MIKDLFKYYFMGGRKQLKAEQDKLAYMMYHTDHDIGMLPGGYLIHYSICYCKQKETDGNNPNNS